MSACNFNGFPPSPCTPGNSETIRAASEMAPPLEQKGTAFQAKQMSFASPLTPSPSPREADWTVSNVLSPPVLTELMCPLQQELRELTNTATSPTPKSTKYFDSNIDKNQADENNVAQIAMINSSSSESSTMPIRSSLPEVGLSFSECNMEALATACTILSSSGPVQTSSARHLPEQSSVTATKLSLGPASVTAMSWASTASSSQEPSTAASSQKPSIPRHMYTHCTTMLPPCRVCGDTASGFHYGVNTCEACKGFFRRSLQQQKEFMCLTGLDSCEVKPTKRRFCPKCRYQKCIDVGMARTAIKTGRYTHQRRTQVIKEVKRIQAESIKSTSFDIKYDNLPITENPNKAACFWPLKCTDDAKSLHHLNENKSDATLPLDEELSRGLQHMIETDESCSLFTKEFIEKIPKLQLDYLEKRRLKEELFGPMSGISYEESKQIYQSTGFDLDGRRKQLVAHATYVERSVKRLITFAKSIPGFRELPMNDQIGLVKNSRFEVHLINSHPAVNAQHGLITISDGTTVSKDETIISADTELVDSAFRIREKLQIMRLTKDETVVLKAIPLCFTDRCELERPDMVEEMQRKLLTLLEYLFKKNHPEDKHVLAKALMVLSDLRPLTDKYLKLCKKFVVDFSIQVPPLIHELLY